MYNTKVTLVSCVVCSDAVRWRVVGRQLVRAVLPAAHLSRQLARHHGSACAAAGGRRAPGLPAGAEPLARLLRHDVTG